MVAMASREPTADQVRISGSAYAVGIAEDVARSSSWVRRSSSSATRSLPGCRMVDGAQHHVRVQGVPFRLRQQPVQSPPFEPLDQFARHPLSRVPREQTADRTVEVEQDVAGLGDQFSQVLCLYCHRFSLRRIRSH